MSITNKRIFVGNLPPDASEDDLKKEFAPYGNVTSVEIKLKKNCIDLNNPDRFAFINLDIDTWGLNRCIQEFSEQQWKGYYLKIAPAKESFLEQLQRERLEAQAQKKTSGKQEQSTVIRKPLIRTEKKTVILKQTTESSSSEDSSESESEKEVSKSTSTVSTQQKKVEQEVESDDSEENEDPDFVIKSNKYKGFLQGQKIKIATFGAALEPKTAKIEKVLTPQALLAEEKRKKSLIEKKEQYNKQKQLLQKSFIQIDAVPKNKIVFKDNTSLKSKERNKQKNNSYENAHDQSKRPKVSLFNENDDDDDENYEFGIKEQFQGNKGQKLLELQSRFSNDKRFALDSRFLENEDETPEQEQNGNTTEYTMEDERQHQIKILENVLGTKVNDNKQFSERNSTTKSMLRYDPTKPDHNKFLNESRKKTDTNMKMNKSKGKDEEVVAEDEPLVSKEKFYAVPDNLKDTIKESNGFSLLSMFGKANDNEVEKGEQDYEESIAKKSNRTRHPMNIQNNPFHYDSSDSDDEVNGDIRPKEIIQSDVGHMSRSGVWRENFFFKEKDERILEGVKFFTNFAVSDDSKKSSDQSRLELRRVVKYKVLNNLRNTKLFKKKLGGHKMRRNIKN